MQRVKKWVLPLLLLLCLILDGVLSKSISPLLGNNTFIVSTQFYLIFQSLIAFYNGNNTYWLYVIVGMGLISDVFYSGIIGINTFLYAVVFYLGQINAKRFPDIKLARGFVTLLSSVGYQLSLGILLVIFRIQTNTGFVSGIPTVIKTAMLTTILFVIFDRLFILYIQKYPFIKSI